jgi:hypothetical protein
MYHTKTRNTYGLILLSAALLQFVLLVTSTVTSFIFFGEHGIQPQWSSYLIALSLLGIIAVGVSQIRTPRETTQFPQRVDIPLGLSLGIVSAILLYIPGLGIALLWAAFGLPMLIGVLLQSPSTISSISPLFALLSVALYIVFAASYSLCAYLVTRRSGSVRQGIWSSALAALATFLGTSLMFSFIDMVAYFLFHTGSGLVAPSSYPDISPLVNYIASYQDTVLLMAIWLLPTVILGLLIALITALISRHIFSKPTFVQVD